MSWRRAGEKWLPGEDLFLTEWLEERVGVVDLSIMHGRSPNAIRCRIALLLDRGEIAVSRTRRGK